MITLLEDINSIVLPGGHTQCLNTKNDRIYCILGLVTGKCYKSNIRNLLKLNNLSEQKFVVRKPHFEGRDEMSCSVILPKNFVKSMNIEKGDYVRFTYHDAEGHMHLEKLEGPRLEQEPHSSVVKEVDGGIDNN